MRALFLAAVSLIATTNLSFAADWTGFYLGANLGGGWANARSDFGAGGVVFATAKNDMTGILGGAQAGYNWQSGRTVFGFEVDFQGTGQSGSLSAPPCPASACGVALSASYSQKMPWFGTVRARLGYTADSWMVYATGGYAYARVNTEASATAGATSATFSVNETRGGYVLGAGIELALAAHWTAKMEYLYLDYGSNNNAWVFAGLPTINDNSRVYENLVRAGVNYKF